MDDQKITAKSRAELEKGVVALNRGDKNTASNHFWSALDCLEDIKDDRIRRDELGPLASYFEHLGLFDLSVMGAREAIVLDKKLENLRLLAEDIVTLGNANMKLGKLDEAKQNYKEALQICLDNSDYDNAASASTNLAGIIANQDKMYEAIVLMRNSLDYLKKKSHPSTEKITRMSLVQALGIEKENPEELLDVAEKLLKRFGNEISPDYINVLKPHIEYAMKEYLQANPDINLQTWKTQHFPLLYK